MDGWRRVMPKGDDSILMDSKVLITIDTEAKYYRIPDPFERDILGNIPGHSYGVDWIDSLLRQHGFSGVFFLDVFGSANCGAPPLYRELCHRLLAHGHTIQLHTHPDLMYEPKRRHMHEYSLAEQTGIIRDGMGLLREWTGQIPIAHRAGRYGANEETLQALHANGIFLDSSFFYGRRDCKLPFPNSNHPLKSHGVWEIPVTVAPEPLEKKGFRFPFWTRRFWRNFQKLDVNCMPAGQLCRSVTECLGRIPYIITFLHSFSFVRREPSGFVPDKAAIEAFQALLRLLAENEVSVVTFEQVAADLVHQKSQQLDTVTS